MPWLALAACSTERAPEAPKPEPVAPSSSRSTNPELHLGALWNYVPAAGLRWLVVSRPKAITGSPAYAAQLDELVEPARLDAFERVSGIDLRQTSQALVAGYDYGTLSIVSADGAAGDPVALFEQRLVAGPRRQFPTSGIQRVVGVIGNTPQGLTLIEDHALAYAVGDTSLARIVELFARAKLSKSHPAFEGAALKQLGPPSGEAQVWVYFPGPFTGDWVTGGHGLVASAEAIRARIRLTDAGKSVSLELTAAGSWEPEAAQQALQLTLTDIEASPLGTLFGFDKPRGPAQIAANTSQASLSVSLALPEVVAGLKALVKERVEDFLPLPDRSGSVVKPSD